MGLTEEADQESRGKAGKWRASPERSVSEGRVAVIWEIRKDKQDWKKNSTGFGSQRS